jgi:hypothetical protein
MGQLVSIPAKIKTKNHQVSERPLFDESFYKELRLLLEWRLDVRHFCTDPLPDGFVKELVSLASLAPWGFLPIRRAGDSGGSSGSRL